MQKFTENFGMTFAENKTYGVPEFARNLKAPWVPANWTRAYSTLHKTHIYSTLHPATHIAHHNTYSTILDIPSMIAGTNAEILVLFACEQRLPKITSKYLATAKQGMIRLPGIT